MQRGGQNWNRIPKIYAILAPRSKQDGPTNRYSLAGFHPSKALRWRVWVSKKRSNKMLNILAYYARSFTRAKWHHSHTETETPPSQPARPCPASGTNWHPQNSGQALYSGWTISIKYKYLLPTTLAHDAGTTPTADYYRFTAHTHTQRNTTFFPSSSIVDDPAQRAHLACPGQINLVQKQIFLFR